MYKQKVKMYKLYQKF